MLFNSYIFIFLFLPLAVAGYFGLNRYWNHTAAKVFILAMSLWFYGYFNYKYLAVIILSIAVNHTVVHLLDVLADGEGLAGSGADVQAGRRKLLLAAALVFDIGMLFYFKYFNFFISNVNDVFGLNFNMRNIVLPLGISFFTFQQISYAVDAYRGETGDTSLLDYSVYVTFFPALTAGPIVTHDEFLPQLKDEKLWRADFENLSKGLMIFAQGLFKKVIVADTFGRIADWGFANIAELSAIDAFVVMFSYTMQIYFDFSAYSDMAIGVAQMFNLKLPVNFNSPYKAFSIMDFWKRWHITLTRFLTKYIYFPLGGSRRGTVRTYANIMIVFLVSGLWHGAAWTFVIWGAMHGIAQCLTRAFKKQYEKLHAAFRWLLTFAFVNVTWILFRADSMSDAAAFLKTMIRGRMAISTDISGEFGLKELDFFEEILHISKYTGKINGFNMLVFFAVTFFAVLNCRNVHEQKHELTVANAALTVISLIWCICSLSGVASFLYFNF